MGGRHAGQRVHVPCTMCMASPHSPRVDLVAQIALGEANAAAACVTLATSDQADASTRAVAVAILCNLAKQPAILKKLVAAGAAAPFVAMLKEVRPAQPPSPTAQPSQPPSPTAQPNRLAQPPGPTA